MPHKWEEVLVKDSDRARLAQLALDNSFVFIVLAGPDTQAQTPQSLVVVQRVGRL